MIPANLNKAFQKVGKEKQSGFYWASRDEKEFKTSGDSFQLTKYSIAWRLGAKPSTFQLTKLFTLKIQ